MISFVVYAKFCVAWFIFTHSTLVKTLRRPYSALEEINEDPLIIVGGQVAPKLKKIIGHIEYIDEKTCLKCHLNEMQINFESRPVLAKKMPHEYRENCVSCHIMQKWTKMADIMNNYC